MKEYQKQLNAFVNYPENFTQAKEYCEKYWLTKDELIHQWISIKNTIFHNTFKSIPEKLFHEEYSSITVKGGLVFIKEDFELLQSCMKKTGDNFFIILEDYDENYPPHLSGPPLRFKYPANITWESMSSGADISEPLFQQMVRNYYVFGDSGKWGKYVGNDYVYPLEIIGFKNEFSNIFHAAFDISDEEKNVVEQWLKESIDFQLNHSIFFK